MSSDTHPPLPGMEPAESEPTAEQYSAYAEMVADAGRQLGSGFDASFADDVEAAKRWAAITAEDKEVAFRLMSEGMCALTCVLHKYGLQANVIWRVKPRDAAMMIDPIEFGRSAVKS